MQQDNTRAAMAAAVIMICFGLTAFYLPTIMLAVGGFSTVMAGAIAVLFVAAFFLVFWLRARSQKRSGD
jgi:hypothetical protein